MAQLRWRKLVILHIRLVTSEASSYSSPEMHTLRHSAVPEIKPGSEAM